MVKEVTTSFPCRSPTDSTVPGTVWECHRQCLLQTTPSRHLSSTTNGTISEFVVFQYFWINLYGNSGTLFTQLGSSNNTTLSQVKDAVSYVEQGHIRVGPNLVTDPAYLVSRNMEDFITWADGSKIKRHVMQYNDELDDFDLLNCWGWWDSGLRGSEALFDKLWVENGAFKM